MQFVMSCLSINEKGNLQMGGCDLAEIAAEYGTPSYVFDEEQIRVNCREYKKSIHDNYDGNGLPLYASKAFSCKRIYEIMKEEGMGVDVVSGGELYTAIAAGFPTEKIYFHGNNKTEEEIEYALLSNVGRIVADNYDELDLIEDISGRMGKVTEILIRIKPGVDAHTHDFVKTGQIDSKFGVALENGEAEEMVKRILEYKNIRLLGFHCHIGSQIFDIEPFEHTAEIMMNFVGDMKDKYGFVTEILNLGGGFGVKYTEEDTPINYGEYMRAVSVVVKATAKRRGVKLPFIIVEPGRSVVAEAGLTLYTVGNVKEIKDIRTYVSVDGGMADNPRYIMYSADYTAMAVENPTGTADTTVTIAGKCCESGDLIGEDMKLPKVKKGDVLAILSTGAYNYSMASNYNRIPRPPVLMVKDGKVSVAVRRETYEDLLKCDM